MEHQGPSQCPFGSHSIYQWQWLRAAGRAQYSDHQQRNTSSAVTQLWSPFGRHSTDRKHKSVNKNVQEVNPGSFLQICLCKVKLEAIRRSNGFSYEIVSIFKQVKFPNRF